MSQAPAPAKEKLNLERLNALSDGVVAIAITLLVLGIEIPTDHNFDSQGLKSFLIQLAPGIIAYITSFVVIALYWMLHHRIFDLAKHSNTTIVRLNMLFLLAVSMTPFTSKVKSLYRFEELAVLLFASTHIFTGIVLLATWKYFISHPDLLKVSISRERDKFFTLKVIMIPLISIIAVLVAFINIHIGTYMFLLIPLVFLILNRVGERKMLND